MVAKNSIVPCSQVAGDFPSVETHVDVVAFIKIVVDGGFYLVTGQIRSSTDKVSASSPMRLTMAERRSPW